MKQGNASYILRLTLTLLVLTLVVAALLGVVNSMTAERIASLKNEKAETAMQQVLPAESYEPLPAEAEGITAAYRAGESGYVVRVSAGGFGGAIDMMVGIDTEGKVVGISVISHSETASLGANCTREDFRNQFIGTDAPALTKDGGTIEALTGATVTSRAVTKGVNLALAFVEEVQQ